MMPSIGNSPPSPQGLYNPRLIGGGANFPGAPLPVAPADAAPGFGDRLAQWANDKLESGVANVRQAFAPAAAPAPAVYASPVGGAGPIGGAGLLPGNKADAFIKQAMRFLGQPYAWGGGHGKTMASPAPVDCSGLVMQAARGAGLNLDGTAASQQKQGAAVSMKSLQPGDLVFHGNPASHVGIYIGNNKVLHAPHTGSKVQIVDLSSYHYFDNARRVFGAPGSIVDPSNVQPVVAPAPAPPGFQPVQLPQGSPWAQPAPALQPPVLQPAAPQPAPVYAPAPVYQPQPSAVAPGVAPSLPSVPTPALPSVASLPPVSVLPPAAAPPPPPLPPAPPPPVPPLPPPPPLPPAPAALAPAAAPPVPNFLAPTPQPGIAALPGGLQAPVAAQSAAQAAQIASLQQQLAALQAQLQTLIANYHA